MKRLFVFFVVTFTSICSLFHVCVCGFSDCGGTVEGSRGTIQSPNFPGPFPVPISCRWIIHAPENSKIVIYFTQHYLRRSLFITEYDSYKSPTENENGNVLGEINTDDRITSLVAYRPYVILNLIVSDGKNLNLRVEEFLGDVHGFNITWLIVPREQPVKTDTCSVHECSFLGNCMASNDYSNFSCECFEGFYGKNCEKGPHCDWEKGRNMCLNGGKCRYFLGSLVNICDCPEGYSGVRCENRLDKDCTALKCSHHCEKSPETGTLQCACAEGYRLDADRVTCSEREQYRISVQMPVKNQTHLEEHLFELISNLDRISQLGTTLLHLSGLTTAQDFTLDGISTASIDFHYYVDKLESDSAAGTTLNLIRGDRFFGVDVEKDDIVVTRNPKTKLLSLENSDGGLAMEGKLLSLSCIARGSEDLEFHWYKDGRPFNLSLTKRNAWEIRLPETMEEKHISVLNIDGVTIYDKGVFTCEITDKDRVSNRSISVGVLQYPHIEVTPLTVSAIKGQTYTFRCLSPDEKKRSFQYRWIKNNRPFHDADDEKIEDLMPSGSRLLIRSAKVTNNYTCIVTNKAGTSSKTVFIFVADANTSSQSCPSNTLHGIKWNKTFGGFFSLRKCPTDAVGFNIRGIGDGYTKRRCTCQKEHCVWHKPSYTGCQSVHLINLYDQLRKVQLGYQEAKLATLYKKLRQIATRARGRMLAGDLDITAQNLLMVLKTARDFPSLVTKPFNSQTLIDFMAILLEETVILTQDEKQEVHTGGRLLQMSEVLIELEEQHLVTLDPVRNSKINMKIEQFYRTVYKDMHLLTSQRKNISIIVKKKQTAHQRIRREEHNDAAPEYKVLQVQYDQLLLQVLDIQKREPIENGISISDILSYVPFGYKWHKRKNHYLIDIPHVHGAQRYAKQKRVTYCLSWERIDREDNKGEWKHDSCFVMQSDSNRTQCVCPLPGHFTVVIVPGNDTDIVADSTTSNLILLVACSVSMYLTFMAISSYLIAWRFLQMVKHSIHFNFILSVFGINLICLLCLLKPDIEFLCVCGTVLLQLFIVAAFTFLLLDAVKLCVEIYAENHPNNRDEFWRFICIGWGIPIFCVMCMLLMFLLVGFIKECQNWCWWHRSHPHFYVVVIPVIILIMTHVVLLILCLLMIRKWNDEWRFLKRKRALLNIAFNKILLVLLATFLCAGVKASNDNAMGSKIFFLVFDILLASAILLLLCIVNRPIRQSVQNCRCSSRATSQAFDLSGFRAILDNGDHLEYSKAEAERIHAYCSRVDGERYTPKHKQKLRVLLNSSSCSNDLLGPSSAPVAGPKLKRESWSSLLQRVPSKLKDKRSNNADSGISEGTGSEKSTTPPTHDISSELQAILNTSCETTETKFIQKEDMQVDKLRTSKTKTPTTANKADDPVRLSTKNGIRKASTDTKTKNLLEQESREESHYINSFAVNRCERLLDKQTPVGKEENSLSLLSTHFENEDLSSESSRCSPKEQMEEQDSSC